MSKLHITVIPKQHREPEDEEEPEITPNYGTL